MPRWRRGKSKSKNEETEGKDVEESSAVSTALEPGSVSNLEIDSANLYALVKRMQGPDGVVVKDRRRHFYKYKQTFKGKDAVRWIKNDGVGGAVQTSDDAVMVGNMLQDAGLIHIVSGNPRRRFRNKNHLYRFVPDNPSLTLKTADQDEEYDGFHSDPEQLSSRFGNMRQSGVLSEDSSDYPDDLPSPSRNRDVPPDELHSRENRVADGHRTHYVSPERQRSHKRSGSHPLQAFSGSSGGRHESEEGSVDEENTTQVIMSPYNSAAFTRRDSPASAMDLDSDSAVEPSPCSSISRHVVSLPTGDGYGEVSVDLSKVAARMSHSTSGVELKDRRVLFRKYRHCFVAREAVAWLLSDGVEGTVVTVQDAENVGNLMVEKHLIYNAIETKQTVFRNDTSLFRFIPFSQYLCIDNKAAVASAHSLAPYDNPATFNDVNLCALATMLTGDDGVRIRDRFRSFKRYKQTFLGSELVEWLIMQTVNGTVKGEADAVATGQALLSNGYIYHATGHPNALFKDNDDLYRFVPAHPFLIEDKSVQQGIDSIDGTKSYNLMKTPAGKLAKLVDVVGLTERLLEDRSFDIGDKRWHLRTFKNCFRAEDLISWLIRDTVDGLVRNENDAMKVAELMMKAGVFHHVTRKKKPFKKSDMWYRFYIHEPDHFRIYDPGEDAISTTDGHDLVYIEDKKGDSSFFTRTSSMLLDVNLTNLENKRNVTPIADQMETTPEREKSEDPAKDDERTSSLRLRIIEARNVFAADLSGTSDPYVKIYAENIQLRTKTEPSTLNPKWNFSTTIPIHHTGHNLQLAVFDHNKFTSDEFIGMIFIPLSDLEPGKELDAWFPLKPRPGKKTKVDVSKPISGDIHLKLLYTVDRRVVLSDTSMSHTEIKRLKRRRHGNKLSAKFVSHTIERVERLYEDSGLKEVQSFAKGILQWEQPWKTLSSLFVYIYMCLYLPAIAIPLAFPLTLVVVMSHHFMERKFFSERIMAERNKRQMVCHMNSMIEEDDGMDDDLFGADRVDSMHSSQSSMSMASRASISHQQKAASRKDEDDSGTSKNIVTKVQEIRHNMQEAAVEVDSMISIVERTYSLITWQDPSTSRIFFFLMLLGVIGLIVVPFRLILVGVGVARFFKWPLMSEDARANGGKDSKSSNLIENLILHSPTTEELYLNEHSIVHRLMHEK